MNCRWCDLRQGDVVMSPAGAYQSGFWFVIVILEDATEKIDGTGTRAFQMNPHESILKEVRSDDDWISASYEVIRAS